MYKIFVFTEDKKQSNLNLKFVFKDIAMFFYSMISTSILAPNSSSCWQ